MIKIQFAVNNYAELVIRRGNYAETTENFTYPYAVYLVLAFFI